MSAIGTHGLAAKQVDAPSGVAGELSAAYAHCAQIVRTRARNFYYGLRLTPEPKRSAIYSVYAWMRRADDEADSAADAAEKRRRLQEFRSTTERMLRGESLNAAQHDPVWLAFGRTVVDYRLNPEDLTHLLDGLERDLELESAHRDAKCGPALVCPTRGELREYCYCVASTVGLVCIDIWGLRPGASVRDARRMAIGRGLAFQLTNILRDFSQDFEEGRVYLSGEDFERFGLSPDELRCWTTPDRCAAMVLEVASWARREYDDSAALDDLLDPACVPAIRAMTGIYSGLLRIIERDPSRIVGARRIRLASWAKAALALRALAATHAWRRG